MDIFEKGDMQQKHACYVTTFSMWVIRGKITLIEARYLSCPVQRASYLYLVHTFFGQASGHHGPIDPPC